MEKIFSTKQVVNLTKATENQIKYWIRINLVRPAQTGNKHFYSFRDIIKIRLIISLKNKGLSLQRIRKGIENLTKALPESDEPLSRLVIYTNGNDMIVHEKGLHFSAITKQQYLCLDTEKIQSKIMQMFPESEEIGCQVESQAANFSA